MKTTTVEITREMLKEIMKQFALNPAAETIALTITQEENTEEPEDCCGDPNCSYCRPLTRPLSVEEVEEKEALEFFRKYF